MRFCDGTNWKAQKAALSANASSFISLSLVLVERETETTTISISSYYPNCHQPAHGHSCRECSPKGKSGCKFVSHSAGNICWSKGWSHRSHSRKEDVTVSDARLPRRGQAVFSAQVIPTTSSYYCKFHQSIAQVIARTKRFSHEL